MHQPPAVVWKLARTRFSGGLLLVLCAVLLCVQVTWWLQADTWGAAQLMAGAAAVAALLHAWRDWRRTLLGHIRWDGQVWSWSGPSGVAQAVVPLVTMDFQFVMLVRLDVRDHGRRWCWVARSQNPVSWRSLRRALFAGAGANAGGGQVRANPPIPPFA